MKIRNLIIYFSIKKFLYLSISPECVFFLFFVNKNKKLLLNTKHDTLLWIVNLLNIFQNVNHKNLFHSMYVQYFNFCIITLTTQCVWFYGFLIREIVIGSRKEVTGFWFWNDQPTTLQTKLLSTKLHSTYKSVTFWVYLPFPSIFHQNKKNDCFFF